MVLCFFLLLFLFLLFLFFFFFQAEDGIRDYKVTGVQTCALPIYLENLRKIFIVVISLMTVSLFEYLSVSSFTI